MLRYKNITDHDLQVANIPGVGLVKAGETVEVSENTPIESPNFELVGEAPAEPAPAQPEAPQQPKAPAPVQPAADPKPEAKTEAE